jgi:hypothetical protein
VTGRPPPFDPLPPHRRRRITRTRARWYWLLERLPPNPAHPLRRMVWWRLRLLEAADRRFVELLEVVRRVARKEAHEVAERPWRELDSLAPPPPQELDR